MSIKQFDTTTFPNTTERAAVAQFLFQQLQEYGDPLEQIKTCIAYALGENNKPGGFILVHQEENGKISGVVIINQTGMEGYIPENILVYIATHQEYRGRGIGKKLMQEALQRSQGDIALHVEPDNPARKLYEKLGFTNKYLEMRYQKEGV